MKIKNLFEQGLPDKGLPVKGLPDKGLPDKDNKSKGKTTSCPSTPFTNSTESDAFRVWLLANYPEYKTKLKPFNVNEAPNQNT